MTMFGTRRLLTLAAALSGLTLLTGPTPAYAEDALAAIKQRGKIMVAIDLGNPPHGMLDAKFEPVGSDVDTAKLLAEELGVPLEIVRVPTPSRVQFLLSNKADVVISALSITPERRKVVEFSIPYATLKTVVAAPAAMNIASYADLSGKGVAVTRGTVNDQYLTRGTEGVSGVNIMRFEDDATSSTAVTSGQLQVYASSLPLITQLKQTNPRLDLQVKFTMQGFPIAIAMRRNDPGLKAYMDKFVETNLRNGKLVEIYRKWQDVTPVPDELINYRD